MRLKNKIVFVTGVGKGIGLAIITKIVQEGGFVYGITRSKEDIKKIQFKNCKIFVGNNAGIRFRKSFTKINESDLRKVFDTNFFSIFKTSQTFLKFWKKKNIKGNIVNISSIVSDLGFSELSLYGATKSALNSLTKSLAAEYSNLGIRFNAIKPGFIKKNYYENFKKNNKKLLKWTIGRTPMSRWGKSPEVANVTAFLISDDSSYINGEIINVDGGWSNT